MSEKLGWCSDCKDNSVRMEIYVRKRDGVKCRFEYCTNKGCGYKQDLPFPNQVKEALCVS